MKEIKLSEMERKFAQIIWKEEPVESGELVKQCEEEFQWKKSTTYTMLKRLCTKQLFQNNNGEVTSIIKEDEFHVMQSEELIKQNFGGSLPKFVTAFANQKKLSRKEIDELQKIIDQYQD